MNGATQWFSGKWENVLLFSGTGWGRGDISTGYQNPIKNIFRIENIVDINMELSRKVVSAALPEFPCVASFMVYTDNVLSIRCITK